MNNQEYIARTMHGMEGLLQEDLERFGAKNCKILRRAIRFDADLETLYRINFRSRVCLSVIRVIHEDRVTNEQELYNVLYNIPWEKYFRTEQSFAVKGIVTSQYFNHTQYVALKSKDALVDRFRKMYGRRPDVDKDNPDIGITVHINQDKLVVSLDSSGAPLFKRGYRQFIGEAPLNEILAAGIVRLIEVDRKKPFLDPMCGSGTLAIEAAGILTDKPAQKTSRKFSFEQWPDFDAAIWMKIKREKPQKDLVIPPIYACDHSKQMVDAASGNAQLASLNKYIQFSCADFLTSDPPIKEGTILMNPPYDIRLKADDINAFYKQIGDTLKHKYNGSTAWIFTANLDAAKSIGLKTSKKIVMFNGPHESRLLKFEMY